MNSDIFRTAINADIISDNWLEKFSIEFLETVAKTSSEKERYTIISAASVYFTKGLVFVTGLVPKSERQSMRNSMITMLNSMLDAVDQNE